MKTIITQYGDGELSLIFQNTESLYNIWTAAVRWNDFHTVQQASDELFDYTSGQMDELQDDFVAEVKEYKLQS